MYSSPSTVPYLCTTSMCIHLSVSYPPAGLCHIMHYAGIAKIYMYTDSRNLNSIDGSVDARVYNNTRERKQKENK